MECNGTNGNGVQSIISLTVPSVGLVVSVVCGIPRPQSKRFELKLVLLDLKLVVINNNRKVYTKVYTRGFSACLYLKVIRPKVD